MRGLLFHRNDTDRAVFSWSGHFPQQVGRPEHCKNSSLNMKYYFMAVGSADLKIGMGLCMPAECKQDDMDDLAA